MNRPRDQRRLTQAALIALAVALVACTRTVDGAPQRNLDSAVDSGRGYGFADERCGLLLDETVQEVVGADELTRPYSGAVCQFVLRRGSSVVDVTFVWFADGTLPRERAVAEDRNAEITDMVFARRDGFLARRGSGCAATAGTNPGVAAWWVAYRGDAGGDPCTIAQALLEKTLAADL